MDRPLVLDVDLSRAGALHGLGALGPDGEEVIAERTGDVPAALGVIAGWKADLLVGHNLSLHDRPWLARYAPGHPAFMRGCAEMRRMPPIRFQISVLMLMSTLNAVILGTAALALFRVLAESPTGAQVSTVEGLEVQLEAVQASALDATATGSAVPERTFTDLDRIGAGLADLGSGTAPVRAELAAYEARLREWNEHLSSAEHSPQGGVEDPAGGAIAHDLVRSDLRTTEAVRELVYYVRPAWVDALAPALPWLGGWVLACTLATVALAGALRQLLSLPLEALRRAADEMADGRLDVPIPRPEGAPEIRSLSRAMSAAQTRLNGTITVLDARNRQTATMLALLGDGVLLVDRTGRILEKNAQAGVLLTALTPRWPASDLLPDLIDELDVGRLCDDEDEQFDLLRGDDHRPLVVACSVRQVPFTGRDASRHWVVVLRDVTEARQLDALQKEFLSVVTHELKTPLVAIEGFTKLLLAQRGGPLSEKQLGWVGTIRQQGQVLLHMVTNLLDATRLDAGSLPIAPVAVDPRTLFQEWTQTWRGVVDDRGLHFVATDDLGTEAGGALLRVDAFRLAQVIGNLVNNALKFTPPGGEIGLGARRVGDEVVLVVHDTGRGIPPDAIPRLFDKFYQVEKGDTRVAGGAGLGLYIVKQLVVAQGGRIEVASEPGHGSAFSLHFPIHPRDPGAPRA